MWQTDYHHFGIIGEWMYYEMCWSLQWQHWHTSHAMSFLRGPSRHSLALPVLVGGLPLLTEIDLKAHNNLDVVNECALINAMKCFWHNIIIPCSDNIDTQAMQCPFCMSQHSLALPVLVLLGGLPLLTDTLLPQGRWTSSRSANGRARRLQTAWT